MNNKLSKRIFKYSICYLLIILFVTILFKIYNKSFIWINVSFDGLDQHFVNLHLLRRFLLGDMHTFFWNIGYGMDLFERRGRLWERSGEEHVEYAHEPEQLLSLLEAAGFHEAHISAHSPQDDVGRLFIIAKR